MIEPPKEFLMDEVREGFFIPAMHKKIMAVLINNYKSLEQWCDRFGLSVYAMYGTAIGALRSGGFIPWDDDIDVQMTTIDYLKLKEESQKGIINDGHIIDDFEKKRKNDLVRKWVDMDEDGNFERLKDWDISFGLPIPAFTDIFCLDYVPADESEKETQKVIVDLIGILVNMAFEQNKTIKHDSSEKADFEKGLKTFEELFNCKIDKTKDKVDIAIDILKQYDIFRQCYPASISDKITEMGRYMQSESFAVPKSFYDDYIEVPFEYTTVRLPIGYEGYLRRIYGNYMKTVFECSSHNYPWYKSYEEKLKKYFGIELLKYEFEPKEISEVLENKTEKNDLDDILSEGIAIFEEAHEFIKSKILTHDEIKNELEENADFATVLDILEQCQAYAISIGENIENRIKNSNDYIKFFEEYCEAVYELHNHILGNLNIDSVDAVFEIMDSLVENMHNLLDNGFEEVKEVLFLPYRTEYWEGLASIYEASKNDSSVNVSVVKVPYYFKDNEGHIIEEPIIEEGYPDNIEFIPWDEYDVKSRQPDVIICQCPYDDYNVSMSIHPYYYMSELRKYTDKLVLIPPFVLRDIPPEDARSRVTLKSFIETPGVIFADKIYVQSENISEVFIELGENFTTIVDNSFNNNKCFGKLLDWKSKIKSLGSPIYDAIKKKEITKQKHDRKKLIFALSGSRLLEYGTKLLDKADRAMEILMKYSDKMNIVLYVDPFAKRILKRNNPDVWDAFRNFLDKYEKNNYIVVDKSADDKKVCADADIYYGDSLIAMGICRRNEIPIMYESPESYNMSFDENSKCNWEKTDEVVDESDFPLENFIRAALEYEKKVPMNECGKKIWENIIG